jgi:flagellar M-ring protein FliF
MGQILQFYNKLNSLQKAAIIGGVTILFIFLIGLVIYANIKSKDAELSYTIATNLTKNQVVLASAELEASGIPFTVVGSGNMLTIKTNKDNVNIAKIKLLTSESIKAKHTGWEIFDKSSLGTTNFENNIKYLRATEGELSRALESLNNILSATVKIAIPKPSVFTQKKAEPSASAILVLREGANLSRKQIEGIKNFIASTIPKLKPKNIKLINQYGSILEKTSADIDSEKYILHNDYKNKLESSYEQKITELLEPVVGFGRVIAKVSVDLDFTKEDSEEEIYNPEGTIRSQQTTEKVVKKEEKKDNPSGVPGVQSNIQNPNENNNNIKARENIEENKNITNYEISKKVVHKKDNAFAKIKKITAGVTFDASVLKDVENKDEYINNIKQLVQDSIGINIKRGDKVTVRALKFKIAETNTTAKAQDNTFIKVFALKTFFKEYGDFFQYLISILILFIFYKKFIAFGDIGGVSGVEDESSGATNKNKERVGVASEDFDFDEVDPNVTKNKLKKKIKNQILAGIEGLDSETAMKYEVLVEDLDEQVNHHPDEVAKMIEVLLSDGTEKLK